MSINEIPRFCSGFQGLAEAIVICEGVWRNRPEIKKQPADTEKSEDA